MLDLERTGVGRLNLVSNHRRALSIPGSVHHHSDGHNPRMFAPRPKPQGHAMPPFSVVEEFLDLGAIEVQNSKSVEHSLGKIRIVRRPMFMPRDVRACL